MVIVLKAFLLQKYTPTNISTILRPELIIAKAYQAQVSSRVSVRGALMT